MIVSCNLVHQFNCINYFVVDFNILGSYTLIQILQKVEDI